MISFSHLKFFNLDLTNSETIIDCMKTETQMLLDLGNLIGFELFQELFDALAENKEFNFSENGLNISAKSSDNGLQIQVTMEQPKKNAKSEAEDFKNYIESLDDELFTTTCESLGGEQLTRISNCLNSDDVEAVRSGVLKFKQELKQVLVNKINYYTECLNNLDK